MFGFLKDIRFHAYLIAALTFIFLWNVNESSKRELRNQSAKLEKIIDDASTIQTTIRDMRSEQAATQEALRLLGEQARKQEQTTRRITSIVKDIQNARPEEDGPIAPVLRSTLNSLERLRTTPNGDDTGVREADSRPKS